MYTDVNKLTDSTSTYQPPEERCEKCKFYKMIDSGYGWCYRYPPKIERTKYIPLRYKALYPEVAWTEKACGEYVDRGRGFKSS